jgi:hypothetical protein
MTLETALNGLNDQLRGALPPEMAEILDADRRRAATDFAEVGAKIEDELPVPHHSGYVAAPHDDFPLTDHQKITG